MTRRFGDVPVRRRLVVREPDLGGVLLPALVGLLLLAPSTLPAAERDLRGAIGLQANPLSLQFRGSLGWRSRFFTSLL